jgi:nucleotide-binding universal stress UspA family protein
MIRSEAKLLVCIPDTPKNGILRAYAQYLRDLLGGEINYSPISAKEEGTRIQQAAVNCDLVIFGEPEQSCLERLLTGHPCGKFVARLPTSFLWARRPRYPIQNILLILRLEETDDAAVEWGRRLAKPSGATITILPIVPSLPDMYSLGNRIQTGLDMLLSSSTPAGQHLRRLAQRMAGWQVNSDLHLRQGEPELQMREEVAEGAYDLIVVGAESHGRLHRLLLGELVRSMLHWVERPLLIARPIHSDKEEIS